MSPTAMTFALLTVSLACFVQARTQSLVHEGRSTLRHPLRIRDAIVNKPYVTRWNFFAFDLFNISAPWIEGYIDRPSVPDACRDGDPQGLSPTMYASDVYLGDCGSSWTVCMAEQRSMSFTAAVVQTARIPVALRRFVSTVVILPYPSGIPIPDNATHWFNTGKDTISCEGVCNQQTFMVSAAVAASRAQGDLANSDAWKQAVASDSCVVFEAAQESYEQAFAQAVLVNVFKHANGFYPWVKVNRDSPQTNDWSCMSHQLAFLDSLSMFGSSFLGDTCAIPEGPQAPLNKAPVSIGPHSPLKGGYTTITPTDTPTMTQKSLTAPPGATTASTAASRTSKIAEAATSMAEAKVQQAPPPAHAEGKTRPVTASTTSSLLSSGLQNPAPSSASESSSTAKKMPMSPSSDGGSSIVTESDGSTGARESGTVLAVSEEPEDTAQLGSASTSSTTSSPSSRATADNEPILRNFALSGTAGRSIHVEVGLQGVLAALTGLAIAVVK